jgi:hypothetical protein
LIPHFLNTLLLSLEVSAFLLFLLQTTILLNHILSAAYLYSLLLHDSVQSVKSAWFLEMGKLCFFLLSVVFLVSLLNGETVTAASRKKVATGVRTRDGSEEWGYVEVRPSKQTVSVFILYIYMYVCY